MQLTRVAVIALFALVTLACSKDENAAKQSAAPAATEVAKTADTATEPTATAAAPSEAAHECGGAKADHAAAEPTATAAAAAAPSEAAHECGGAKQHEGGGCGDMAKAEGGGCGDMAKAEGGGCNQWDDASKEVTGRDVPEGALWASYDVDGMTCGGCERRIQAKVGEIDGVVAVEASAELGKVRVAVAPEAKDSQDRAKARIAELGYKVR